MILQKPLSAAEIEGYTTGLPELTDEELEWQNKHMNKVKKVKLNKLGLERVNDYRKAKGLDEITELSTFDIGQDIETVVGVDAPVEQADQLAPNSIPPAVDNSLEMYFPPIRSQGSLASCGVFNGTYYTMTYMLAMANGHDAKDGGDAYRLSPKWCYNMVNNGSNTGSWYYWAYEIGQKNGVASWEEFPYDSNYREWSTQSDVWVNSLYRRFDQYGYVNNTDTDSGIELVKQMLLNGYILNFPTYINSWVWKTVQDDTSTTEDDGHVGDRCAYWVNGNQGYHARVSRDGPLTYDLYYVKISEQLAKLSDESFSGRFSKDFYIQMVDPATSDTMILYYDSEKDLFIPDDRQVKVSIKERQ